MENNKNQGGFSRATSPASDSAAQLSAPPPGFPFLPRFFLPFFQAATLKPAAALPPTRAGGELRLQQ